MSRIPNPQPGVYLQVYTIQAFSSFATEPRDVVGARFILWLHAAARDGYLPADDEELQLMAGLSPERWEAVRHRILTGWELRETEYGKEWWIRRVALACECHRKRVEGGKAGARRRWESPPSGQPTPPPNDYPDGSPIGDLFGSPADPPNALRDQETKRTRDPKKEEEGAAIRRLYSHWLGLWGFTEADRDLTKTRESKIRARLREFDEPTLVRALDAHARSTWHQEHGVDDISKAFKNTEAVEKWVRPGRRQNGRQA